MNRAGKILSIILRCVGRLETLAIIPLFFPHQWMNAIHDYLGLGQLPDVPIVSYLTRSLCAFYAIHGAITWFISYDIERYGPLIRLWACASVLLGVVLLVVDITAGIPPMWTLTEGPFVIVAGVVVLWLERRSRQLGGDR